MCKAPEITRHNGQRIGYARVSSTDQKLARQLATLGRVDRLFEEKQSGAKRDGRTTLAEMIAYARQGDTVMVSFMDRLARSDVDLNQFVAELIDKGVAVEFITEKATFHPSTKGPFSEFQLNIMASFVQLERSISEERQAEGIKTAKARGVYQGRAPKMKTRQLAEARELIETGVPKARVARQLGVDRSTLYRALSRDASTGVGEVSGK